ncbi:hypothetical protein [Priestia aryabhattai]|uniref:hypothetical protein n=1 Tax=Priestia aryabhattai TaxID=412384 RepID=UPI003B6715A5
MKHNFKFVQIIIISLLMTLLFFITNTSLIANAQKPEDKITIIKKNNQPSVSDPELQEKQDQVWNQLVKTDFSNKVDKILKQNGYKRYTHTGEFDINYQIVHLEVAEKKGESKIETIQHISDLVTQLAKENKVVPTITTVEFHKKNP